MMQQAGMNGLLH